MLLTRARFAAVLPYSQVYLAARAANSAPIRSYLRAIDPEQVDGDDPSEV